MARGICSVVCVTERDDDRIVVTHRGREYVNVSAKRARMLDGMISGVTKDATPEYVRVRFVEPFSAGIIEPPHEITILVRSPQPWEEI